MVKEYAIIFKRKDINEYEQEFIPIEIIEGKYNEDDNWFLDKNDNVYPHITELTNSGNCYGYRFSEDEINNEIIIKNFEETKEMILMYLRYASFKRNKKNNYCIVVTNLLNNDQYLFEDKDSINFENNYYGDQYSSTNTVNKSNKKTVPKLTMSPQEMFTDVRKTIKGQDEAIKKITTAIWTTYIFRKLTKRNMLVYGPTGVGKTAIFNILEKLVGIPVTIYAISGSSQAGYVGKGTDEILKQVYYNCDEDIGIAERSIVILDEIDKLAYRGSDSGNISTVGVQDELLKIIEGVKMLVNIGPNGRTVEMDTSNMLFVGVGAFSELYKKEEKKRSIGFNSCNSISEKKEEEITTESFIEYGMKSELLGRLPVVVRLNALTEEILKEIILESEESEFLNTIEAIESMDIEIVNKEFLVDLIAKDAIEKEIGARGLVGTITDVFTEIIYQISAEPDKYKQVIIGENILKDNKDFQLIQRNRKRKTRTMQIKG